MTRQEKIAYMKSFSGGYPPVKASDPYYTRHPWNKLGTLEPYAMRWVWRTDQWIEQNVTDAEIDLAFSEYVK